MENASAPPHRRVPYAAYRAVIHYDGADRVRPLPRWVVAVGGAFGAALLGLLVGAALAV